MKKNKFAKVKKFIKPLKYVTLLMKYNTLANDYNTLVDLIKTDLYKEIIDGAYKKAEDMEHYKTENKKLRKKLKELKSLSATKSK